MFLWQASSSIVGASIAVGSGLQGGLWHATRSIEVAYLGSRGLGAVVGDAAKRVGGAYGTLVA
jgi:hypothetical protein